MDFHLYVHPVPAPEVPAWAIELKNLILQIQTTQVKIMATLDQVLADVTAESTQLDSISTLITGLKQQLADALAGTTLPPDVQAKIDAVFAAAEVNKAKIATALSANTPAASVSPTASGA